MFVAENIVVTSNLVNFETANAITERGRCSIFAFFFEVLNFERGGVTTCESLEFEIGI